jgi:hypothetical protein
MIKITYNKLKQRIWYSLTDDLKNYRYTYVNEIDGYRLIASGYKHIGWNSYSKYIELPRQYGFVSQWLPKGPFETLLKLLDANNLEYEITYLPEKARL